jgi:hypothetical protein
MNSIEEVYKELDDISISTHQKFMALGEDKNADRQEFFFALARVIDDIEWLKAKLEF